MDVTEVRKLDAYLRKLFGNAHIRVVPKKGDTAEVFVGEDDLGELTVDDEDGDRSFNFRMVIQVSSDPSFQPVPTLTAYLRGKFDNENIRVVTRPKKTDSLEAYIGEEFLGVLFVENEKGRRSYIFELPILDVDLEPAGLSDYPGIGRKLAISRSMPSATLRQSPSHSRGKRIVMSAPAIRRSCRHIAGRRADLAGAAEQETLRRRRIEDQVLALVGRAVAEMLHAEPVGPDGRVAVEIARIDRP